MVNVLDFVEGIKAEPDSNKGLVINQVKDLSVYVVFPFNADRPQRVSHQDLFLPFSFLLHKETEPQI